MNENKARKLNIKPNGLDCKSLSTHVKQTSGQGLFKQERDICIEEGGKCDGYCVWIQTTRTNACVKVIVRYRTASWTLPVQSSGCLFILPSLVPTHSFGSYLKHIQISLLRSCNTGKEEMNVKLPLQLFPQLFDLLVLLGQDLLHVAVGCGLLELPIQLLQMQTHEG